MPLIMLLAMALRMPLIMPLIIPVIMPLIVAHIMAFIMAPTVEDGHREEGGVEETATTQFHLGQLAEERGACNGHVTGGC